MRWIIKMMIRWEMVSDERYLRLHLPDVEEDIGCENIFESRNIFHIVALF